jgi:hypothetical protein
VPANSARAAACERLGLGGRRLRKLFDEFLEGGAAAVRGGAKARAEADRADRAAAEAEDDR